MSTWQYLKTLLLQEAQLPLLLAFWVLVRLLSIVERRLRKENLVVRFLGKEIILITNVENRKSHTLQGKEKTPVTDE